MLGTVLSVQRFCWHDGPGLRTTVFLKGCPLTCRWCHNPESRSEKPELVWDQQKCVGCGLCQGVCLEHAVTMSGGFPVISRAICRICGDCQEACPSGALTVLGQLRTPEEILDEVLEDRVFYETSGGGVTFSGGEPLQQPQFLARLLALCKVNGLHTTVDTSGYASEEDFLEVLPHTDLFLYDIKHMDDGEHRRLTGVGNALVLANLRALSRLHSNINLRLPLIPDYNDSSANLQAVRALALELHIAKINLLPYHPFARGKYERMLLADPLVDLRAPTENELARAVEALKHPDLTVSIGG